MLSHRKEGFTGVDNYMEAYTISANIHLNRLASNVLKKPDIVMCIFLFFPIHGVNVPDMLIKIQLVSVPRHSAIVK